MQKAYFNYPNKYITVHQSADCALVQQQHKKGQRYVRLDIRSFSEELNRFAMRTYRFASQSELNDMWLELDFGNSPFEKALVAYVKSILARRYTRFDQAKIQRHC